MLVEENIVHSHLRGKEEKQTKRLLRNKKQKEKQKKMLVGNKKQKEKQKKKLLGKIPELAAPMIPPPPLWAGNTTKTN